MVWVAVRPSESCAVTVTVAVPADPGANHTVSPDTKAVTVPTWLDVAEYVNRSSSGSLK